MDEPDLNIEDIIHVGYRPDRCEHPTGDLERAFAFRWLEINTPDGGAPLLVKLLDRGRCRSTVYSAISQRDAHVAATIIQWLGTNVGFGFLISVLEEAGYKLDERERNRL
jgi:hypothetical protein